MELRSRQRLYHQRYIGGQQTEQSPQAPEDERFGRRDIIGA
jgi:hypothetical protein